jgi:hypothetical protein
MKRENFQLQKVKLISGGIEAEYVDLANPNSDITESRQVDPHPHLRGAIELLRCYVANATHLDSIQKLKEYIASETGKKEYQGILAKATSMQDDILQNIEVRGLSIKGEDEKQSVVITSVLTCNGARTAINTPRILLNGTKYGTEGAMQEDIDAIVEETFQYLFNGKAAQLEMDFEDDEEETE